MIDAIRQTFEWHFLTRYPPRYLEKPFLIGLFGEWVSNQCATDPDFATRLRAAAIVAIDEGETTQLRQALQVLAHVGHSEDATKLQTLLAHQESQVVQDTETCIFEITHRTR